MAKKIIYLILGLLGVLTLLYVLQPMKRGRGSDVSVSYTWDTTWPKLPSLLKLGNPSGIGIDTGGNVIVFHRAGRDWPLLGAMPKTLIADKTILVINKDNGTLVKSWGDNLFVMPHGLTVDSDNNIWVTDVGLHQVFKFSYDGKLLLRLGEAGVAGKDQAHFNKPTDIAAAKDGSFYVSDGYGNSRVVKFTAEGKYLFEWGTKGNGEGQFNIPHSICIDSVGNVYVADRENDRVQVFDANGRFIKQLTGGLFGEICGVTFNVNKTKLFAVDDVSFFRLRHRGSDVLILDSTGMVKARFGRSGNYTGPVCWYHDLTVDKDENIFVTDILNNTIQKFKRRR
ncbi:MAG: hypothetical protein J0I41_04980 [Filimonas sp.]|nr:hypothetical protein [Filimonas sp.]